MKFFLLLVFNFFAYSYDCSEYLKKSPEILKAYDRYKSSETVKTSLTELNNYIRKLKEDLSDPDLVKELEGESGRKIISFINKQFLAPSFQGRASLSSSDLKLIQKSSFAKNFHIFMLYFHEISNHSMIYLAKPISQAFSGPSSRVAFANVNDVGQLQRLLTSLKEKLYIVLNIINPIAFEEIKHFYYMFGTKKVDLHKKTKSVRDIFIQQFYNPQKELIENEKRLLISKGLYNAFITKKEYLTKHPNLAKVKMSLNLLQKTTSLISSMFVAHYYFNMNENDVGIDEFLARPALEKNEIQIIIDQVPFPHLALRVGGKVYSYGVERVTSSPFGSYLSSANIRQWLVNRGHLLETSEDKLGQEQVSLFSKSFMTVGLLSRLAKEKMSLITDFPHSAMVFTLNLLPANRLRLIRYLEDQVGKSYDNDTGINDCASMIVRALNASTSIRLPWLLNASPNQLGLWLSEHQRVIGSFVRKSELLVTQREDKVSFHAIRNSMIANAESKAFIKLFPIIQGVQVFKENTREKLQWYSEDELEKMALWKGEAIEEFESNYFIKTGDQIIKELLISEKSKSDKDKLIVMIQAILMELDNQYKEYYLSTQSLELDVKNIQKAYYKIELIETKRAELDKLLKILSE